jgi:hypothetical protein
MLLDSNSQIKVSCHWSFQDRAGLRCLASAGNIMGRSSALESLDDSRGKPSVRSFGTEDV